jgi:hypothetical protein
MQWDDPYDIRDPVLNQPPIYSNTGTIGAAGTPVTYTDIPPFVQGTGYVINVIATSGDFDAIVTLTDPSGTNVIVQDTGTDETVFYYAPISGQYKITISRFATTTGNFNITINTTATPGVMTTDLNLLVFRADTGAYLSTRSLTTDNIASNRPVELGGSSTVNSPAGQTQIQFVVARRNIPVAPRLPTRVRISTRGNGAAGIGPAEYFAYNAVTTKGHATAKGCNGTAAYSVFRPNTPEVFTSPGPATILFDKNANLLATPELRLCPTVAAVDGANDSDFSSDSTGDLDTQPNFFGTSSAAPHAAAVAALVLQAKGGPGSVTPLQMRSILQRSAFPHDLDPSFASGVARATPNGGKVTITVTSDNDSNTSTGQNDPNSMTISYIGPSSLASLTFNPAGTASTGGGVTGGNNGYFDTPASSPATVTYFENDFPGLIFETPTKAFTLGASTGLTAADVVATPSNPAGAPTPAGAGFWTLGLNFPTGNFTGGKILRFTVGRGLQHSANVQTGAVGTTPGPGTSTVNPLADLFGGGVFIPRNQTVANGMAFSGTLTDGSTFSGVMKNRIGVGYTNVDGYGLMNAEAAVMLPVQ